MLHSQNDVTPKPKSVLIKRNRLRQKNISLFLENRSCCTEYSSQAADFYGQAASFSSWNQEIKEYQLPYISKRSVKLYFTEFKE